MQDFFAQSLTLSAFRELTCNRPRVVPPCHPVTTTTERQAALDSRQGTVSVIIPVWRESASLVSQVAAIRGWAGVCEVIVVAADADAAWLESMREAGAQAHTVEKPSRGRQMNHGASMAKGRWLLFHHADTMLTPAHVASLAAIPGDGEILGGAFYRKFDERHPWLRWLERVERWRNRSFGALYGDQSIFVRSDVFQRLGGYAAIPLMEDVELSLRLRRAGRIALLDPPIASSPRKHLRQGPWRTTFQNASLILLYKLGVSPHRLHSWYYPQTATISKPTPLENHHENQTHPTA